ncbi:MAG: NAD(+) synthase [Bacteroidales bacterium]|nr:NAD(+) synthase [Bacteroidales bacterium]
MQYGFYRVAAAAPKVTVADPVANTDEIIELFRQANRSGADAVVFPEMSVTAYTCGELFHNATLLEGARQGLLRIARESLTMPGTVGIVGAPVRVGAALYNCACFIAEGVIHALVPKTYIPNYNEFYEKRWWKGVPAGFRAEVDLGLPYRVPMAQHMIIRHKGVGLAAEICEDVWSTIPPSSRLALQGAEVIFNLSASDDLIGKYNYLLQLIKMQSARCLSAYVYSSAGFGESSTDLVFDAKLVVAENGTILAKNRRWQSANQIVMADTDIEALRRDRLHTTTFADCAEREIAGRQPLEVVIEHNSAPKRPFELMRKVDAHPFVPANDEHLHDRCEEIINIQVAALAQRLNVTHTSNLVIGISGGLDSTLALLIAVRTFDRLGLDRKGIHGITMPGFGTTGRTRSNALILMEALGVSTREIPIGPAVNQHFADIGHDPAVQDVTYENSQARERTQILMDVANQVNGMVLGTGDLSELALGWATYNGDHMSMYGINASVPKTLVVHLTRYFAMECGDERIRTALLDIVDTPISPELIPAAADGTIKQKTEDLVGPYELHDFFLYYVLRYGFTPERILLLARKAFGEAYTEDVIRHWLRTFMRRFFRQQFKRSCLPDGPKIGSVCLSPRGDWRMPSDASPDLWLSEIPK